MNMLKSITLMSVGYLLLGGIPATADEVIIIYRSGKIQTLQIDSAADPVEQVSFRRKTQEAAKIQQPQTQPSGAPAISSTAPATAPSAAPAVKTDVPAKTPDKSGVKIKWAEPMDAKY